MPRRVWLSLVMLALGGALMVAAQLAGAAPARKGGIFEVGTSGASVQIDPQLSYVSTGWWLEYATAAKLYNYRPGGKLVPEVASGFKVSNGGRRYTFSLRKGFRFSDGTPVTARSFEYAFERAKSPELQSPAAQFVTSVRGVHAHGMKLVIDLSSTESNLISTLAMPFFQATSTKLPLDREVFDVRSMGDLPTAGPYAFTLNDANTLTSLRRNPYWRPGPGRTAPSLAGLDVHWSLNEQAAFEMVQQGQLDEGPVPAAEVQNVVSQYGVNRSRFWREPSSCLSAIGFDNRHGLFQGNAAMRRAFNWALDRTDYIGSSVGATPWTHLLPPGVPGSITTPRLQPYATTARLGKARRLAAGHFKDGKVTVIYSTAGTVNQVRAEKVRQTLVNLGFDAANITMKGLSGGDWYDAIGRGGFDLAVSLGLCSDYPGGTSLFFPTPFPNNVKYENKIAAALRLRGNARAAALGKLDLDITRNVAPAAVTTAYNNQYFFSSRVDPQSLRYHRVYKDWTIPSLALK
jgi:ABC-type transport system substrate-binding protein